jgi:hypothetical protein
LEKGTFFVFWKKKRKKLREKLFEQRTSGWLAGGGRAGVLPYKTAV